MLNVLTCQQSKFSERAWKSEQKVNDLFLIFVKKSNGNVLELKVVCSNQMARKERESR